MGTTGKASRGVSGRGAAGCLFTLTAGCSAESTEERATSDEALTNETTSCEVKNIELQQVVGVPSGNVPVPGASDYLLVKAECHRTDFHGLSNLYAPLTTRAQLQAALTSGASLRIAATNFYVGEITAINGRPVGKLQPNARPDLVFQAGRTVTDTGAPEWALVPGGSDLSLSAQDAAFKLQILTTHGRRDTHPSQHAGPGHEHTRFDYLRIFAEGAVALDEKPNDPIALSARDSKSFSSKLGLTSFPATFALGKVDAGRQRNLVCSSSSSCTVK
jgi:hypothetical protein